jgi:two-component system response regulator CpxR
MLDNKEDFNQHISVKYKVISEHQVRDKISIAQVELNFLNRSVLFMGKSVVTTGLEFNLLTVLMNNAGSLVSREFIAKSLFQRKLSACDKSINSHMANLRKKFLVVSARAVIKTVKGKGYMFITS